MAEAVFIKVRLYSYGKSGAGSYSCYGSGRIGVTENRNCQSPGYYLLLYTAYPNTPAVLNISY